jgi:hypothetical protein
VWKDVPMRKEASQWVCKEHKDTFDRQCRVRRTARARRNAAHVQRVSV